MPITLTCPSCGQQCAVKEEYAGMQVRCPRCPGVIAVPAAVQAAVIVEPEPVIAMPAPSAPPPMPEMPRPPAGPTFIDNVTRFLAANGVGGVNLILLLVGLGCLAFFLITILLPWSPSLPRELQGLGFDFGGAKMNFGVTGGSSLGILQPEGLLYFFLTIGVLFLFVFVVMLGWSNLFDYSLWTVTNWSIIVALHLLLHIHVVGWGRVLAFIVMAGAAATLGVVTFTRLFARKPAAG